MSIIFTKITPPRYGHPLLKRQRLLDEAIQSSNLRLIFVQASAGYGKSTLLYQIRSEKLNQDIAVAWYSLEESDNDQSTFMSYLSSSIDHSLDRDLPAINRPDYPGIGGVKSIRSYIPKLINDIRGSGRKITLILDDFHLIIDQGVLAACQSLIDYAPENLQLIISSRSRLSLNAESLFAYDQAVRLEADTLQFNIDETEWYLKNASKLSLSPHQIYSIQDSTEGWAAGLQLTSLALKRKVITDDLIEQITHKNRTTKNYLAEQVLEQQDDNIRMFLLRSSIVQKFNIDLCNTIMGISDAGKILKHLEDDNLFIYPLTENKDWYRYHHSFSQFLEARLHYEMPDIVPGLHATACDWFENNGYVPEAIAHAIESMNQEHAIRLLETHAMDLVKRGMTTTLLNMINRLPGFVSTRPSMLSLAIAWSLILVRKPDDAMIILKQLEDTISNKDELLATRIEVALLTAMCWQDRPMEAKSRIMEILPTGMVQDPWDIGVMHNNIMYGSIFDGNIRHAESAFRVINSSQQSLYTSVYGKVLMGICLRNKARLYEAANLFQEALNDAVKQEGTKSPAAALAAANMAALYYEWNDLTSVKTLLEGCMELIDETSINDVLITVYTVLIRTYTEENKTNETEKLIEHALTIGITEPYGERFQAAILTEQIRVALIENKFNIAEMMCHKFLCFIEDHSDSKQLTQRQLRIYELMSSAELAFAAQKYPQAVSIADELINMFNDFGDVYNRFKYQILKAISLYFYDNRDEALMAMGLLIQQANFYGLVRMIVDFGDPVKEILKDIRNRIMEDRQPTSLNSIDITYLDTLETAFRDHTPLVIKNNQEPLDNISSNEMSSLELSNRQLEILRLIARGKSNKQIAATLFLALNTVKWHLKIIYKELGVSSRTQAVNKAKKTLLI